MHKRQGHKQGESSPIGIITPEYITQLYMDIINKKIYVSTGLTSSDWTISTPDGGGGGRTSIRSKSKS